MQLSMPSIPTNVQLRQNSIIRDKKQNCELSYSKETVSTESASQRGQPMYLMKLKVHVGKIRESPSNLIVAKRAADFTHQRVRQKLAKLPYLIVIELIQV